MASTFVTLPTPFLHRTTSFSSSNNTFPVLKRHSFKVNALVSNKWEPTKVVPQADRVLIRLEALPDKTAGGVLLPKSAVKFERYLMGEILSVGAEAGEEVKAGSKVLFTDMNAYEVYRKIDSISIAFVVINGILVGLVINRILLVGVTICQVDLGTDEKHCFCKASDLLAVVE
ncbi:hypothetical protein AHAS_Ahas19G0104700 [Arachis hypogaea]